MPLLVGLGNPGPQYENTRHNIGFALVDSVAKTAGVVDAWKPWGKSQVCKASLGNHSLILAKPQTFMNLSGEAVLGLLTFYKIPLVEMVVVADDVSLPLGAIRVRAEGGHGGHNGLRDIVERIGEGFPRIRVGIGPCPEGWDLAAFVLGKMGETEWNALKPVFAEFSEVVESGFARGWDFAGSRFNRKPESPSR